MRANAPTTRTDAGLREALITIAETQNANVLPWSDSMGFGGYDLDVLRTAIEGAQVDRPDQACARYLTGLAQAAGMDPVGRRIVEKSVENAEFVEELARMYPDAQFLFIVRNPYANLVAMRKYLTLRDGRYPRLVRPAAALATATRAMLNATESLPERCHVIQYEELVTMTETVMVGVAEFLGVPMGKALTRPTRHGALWSGNSTSGVAFEGVSSERVDAWLDEVSPSEISVTNAVVGSVINRLGYEVLVTPRRRRWLPTSGESPRVWLLNRTLPWSYPPLRPFAPSAADRGVIDAR